MSGLFFPARVPPVSAVFRLFSPVSGSTVCRAPLPMIPAGNLSGNASRAATVRAAPPDSGNIKRRRNAAPPVSLSGKPWRPCAAPEASGLSAVRPFDRWPEAGKRPPVPRQSQAVRAGFPPPSNAPPDSATVRPLAGSVRAAGTPRNRSRLSAVRKFRQAVATVCRPLPMIPAGDLSGKASRAATVRAAPPVSDSGEHRNAATVRGIDSGMSRGQAVATVCRPLPMIPATSNAATVGRKCAAPPVSLSGKDSGNRSTVATVRACQRFGSRHHRTRASRGDRVPPDSGQCRRILPAVCATVGRPPCYRGNRSRLARLISPETRRNRPPLRPPAPDGFAPVTPCRALARPFNAA